MSVNMYNTSVINGEDLRRFSRSEQDVNEKFERTVLHKTDTSIAVFEELCKECGGHGIIYNPAWAEWSRAFDEADERECEELLDLMPASPEEICCPKCNGQGTVLTEFGLTLLRFIRKYL